MVIFHQETKVKGQIMGPGHLRESFTKLGIVGCVLALDLSRAASEAKGWVCTHTVYLGCWRPKWDEKRQTRGEAASARTHCWVGCRQLDLVILGA